jgi:Domain of unknown function (DUF4402)
MNINGTYYFFRKFGLPIILLSILLNLFCPELSAQEPPPKPVVVTVTRNLGFGAFTHGSSGGTVIINSGGSRFYTGDVILLNLGYSFSAAQYKLVAAPGTVISILNGPDVHLNGSGGGYLVLHIGDSSPVSPFVITTIPPDYTLMNVGGTLTVGNTAANPPGNYSGTFDITFIQE